MQWHLKSTTQAICVGLLSLGLAGCFDSDSSSSDPEETATADVRVIHAVADAPDVNASLNDGGQVEGLAFTEATDLLEVPAGDYSVSVDALLPDGGSVDGVIDVDSLTLAENTENSILATGSVSEVNIAPVVVVPPDEPIEDSKARFNVVHAAEGAPEVDIYATTPDNNSLGSTPAITLEFGEQASAQLFSDPDREDVPPRRIRIAAAGADPSDDSNILFDSGALPELPSGEDYVLAAINNTGAEDSPVRLLAVTGDTAEDVAVFRDKDAQPAARAAHFSPDAGTVGVAVGGQTVVQAFDFTQNSGFLRVPDTLRNQDGSATVDVGPGAVDADVPLVDGDFHTGYAVGLAAMGSGDTALDLIAGSDPIRPIATEAQVRVVHAASQVPTQDGKVDVYLGDGANAQPIQELQDVAFKDISPYLSLPVDLASGTEFTFQVLSDGTSPDGTNAAIEVTATFNPGDVFTVVARDDDTSVPSFDATVIDDAQAVEELRNAN